MIIPPRCPDEDGVGIDADGMTEVVTSTAIGGVEFTCLRLCAANALKDIDSAVAQVTTRADGGGILAD